MPLSGANPPSPYPEGVAHIDDMTKTLVNIDWLGVSLTDWNTSEPYFDGIHWIHAGDTNVWNQRWLGYNEFGELVFTVLFEPKSKVISRSAALLEVANQWLYEVGNISARVHYFCEANNCSIGGISRIDLAGDFECDNREFDVICGLAKGDCYVAGKRNRSCFWSSSNDERIAEEWRGKEIPHQVSHGHKTTAITWKVYYKWKELTEAAGKIGWTKPYIVRGWERAGFDRTKVWRLEAAIKGGNNFTRGGQPLQLDDVLACPEETFWQLYDTRYEVRRLEGHADKRNDKAEPLLIAPGVVDRIKSRVTADNTATTAGTRQLRRLILDLDEPDVYEWEDARLITIEHIELLCRDHRLHAYATAIVGEDIGDYLCKKRRLCP